MHSSAVCFYLYYPETLAHWGKKIARDTGAAARISYSEFKRYFAKFEDIGEINPNYTGLKRLHQNFILLMTNSAGVPLAFCLFRLHRGDLVEIDIIVVRKGLRRLGLGGMLYSHLEQSFVNGTAFFVETTTFAGGRFFKKCGFYKDVDLIKVLEPGNRVAPACKRGMDRQWIAC